MEDIEQHYNALEKELAMLVRYHISRIELLNKNNIIRSDDAEGLRVLNYTFEVINRDVKERLAFAEHERKEEESLLAQRTIAECPTCNENRKVVIKGETITKKSLRVDIVECTVCNRRFANYVPNNTKDLILFNENFFEQLYKVREDGKTYADKFDINEKYDREKMLEDLAQFKKAYEEAEKRKKEYFVMIKNSAKTLENCRDQLLLAKIKDDNWNMKTYMA